MSLIMTFIAQVKLASHYMCTSPLLIHLWVDRENLTHPISIWNEERKLTKIVILSLLCDASKGFMKFLKTFETSQRSAEIKILS